MHLITGKISSVSLNKTQIVIRICRIMYLIAMSHLPPFEHQQSASGGAVVCLLEGRGGGEGLGERGRGRSSEREGEQENFSVLGARGSARWSGDHAGKRIS